MWLVGGFWGRLAPAGVVVGVSGVVLGLGSVVLGSLVLSGFGSCWLSRESMEFDLVQGLLVSLWLEED